MKVCVTLTELLVSLVVVVYLIDAHLIDNDDVDARKSHYFSFHMNDNMKSISNEQTIQDLPTIGQTFNSLNVTGGHQASYLVSMLNSASLEIGHDTKDIVQETHSERKITNVMNLQANDSVTIDFGLPDVIIEGPGDIIDDNYFNNSLIDGNQQTSDESVTQMSMGTKITDDSRTYNNDMVDEISFISDIINEIMSVESSEEHSDEFHEANSGNINAVLSVQPGDLLSRFQNLPSSFQTHKLHSNDNEINSLKDNSLWIDRERTDKHIQMRYGPRSQPLFELLHLFPFDYNEPSNNDNELIDTFTNEASFIPEVYAESLYPTVTYSGQLTSDVKKMLAWFQDNIQSRFSSLPTTEILRYLASPSSAAEVNKIIESLQEDLKIIKSWLASLPEKEREYVIDKMNSLTQLYKDHFQGRLSQMLDTQIGKTDGTEQQASQQTGESISSNEANDEKSGSDEFKNKIGVYDRDVFNEWFSALIEMSSDNLENQQMTSLQRNERSKLNDQSTLEPLKRRERSKDWSQSDVSSMNHKIRNKKLFLTQQFQMMKHEKSQETRQMAGLQNNQILPWGISAQSEGQDLFDTEGINTPPRPRGLDKVKTGSPGKNDTHLINKDIFQNKTENNESSVILTNSTNHTRDIIESLVLNVNNMSQTFNINQTLTGSINWTNLEDDYKMLDHKNKRNIVVEDPKTVGMPNKSNTDSNIEQDLNITLRSFSFTSANYSSVNKDVGKVDMDEKIVQTNLNTSVITSFESNEITVNNMSLPRDKLKQSRDVNETLELPGNETKKVVHDTRTERKKRHVNLQFDDSSSIGPVPSWILYVPSKPTTTEKPYLLRPPTTLASVHQEIQQPTVTTLKDIRVKHAVTINQGSWKSTTATFQPNVIKQMYVINQGTSEPVLKANNERIAQPTSFPLDFVKNHMMEDSKTHNLETQVRHSPIQTLPLRTQTLPPRIQTLHPKTQTLPPRTQTYQTESYIDRYIREKQSADNSLQKRGPIVTTAQYQNHYTKKHFGENVKEPKESVSNSLTLKSEVLNKNIRNEADENAKSLMSYADRFLHSKNQMEPTVRSFVSGQTMNIPVPINSQIVSPQNDVYDSSITEPIGNSRGQMNSNQVPSQYEISSTQMSDHTVKSNLISSNKVLPHIEISNSHISGLTDISKGQMISNKVFPHNAMYRTDQWSPHLKKTTIDVSARHSKETLTEDSGVLPMEAVLVHYQPVITYYTPPIHYSQIPDYLDFTVNLDTPDQWAPSKNDPGKDQGSILIKDSDEDQRVLSANDPEQTKDDQDSDHQLLSTMKDYSLGDDRSVKISKETEEETSITTDDDMRDQSDTSWSHVDEKVTIYNPDNDHITVLRNDERKTSFNDPTVFDDINREEDRRISQKGYENRYQNIDSRYRNIDSGYQNLDSRYRNIDSGYKNINSGSKNINSGSRNYGNNFNFGLQNKRKYLSPVITDSNVQYQNLYLDETINDFTQHNDRTVNNVHRLSPQKIGRYNQQNPTIKKSFEDHDKDDEAVLQFIYSKKKMNTEYPGMSNGQDSSNSNYYERMDSSLDKGEQTGEDKMIDEIVEHYIYTKPKYAQSNEEMG